MKLYDRFLLAGIFFLIVIAIIIVLPINEVTTVYEYYSGRHAFSIDEYAKFKQAVFDYADDNSTELLFSHISIINDKEPILVEYEHLDLTKGFPYGDEIIIVSKEDGNPGNWMKFMLALISLACFVVALAIYCERP